MGKDWYKLFSRIYFTWVEGEKKKQNSHLRDNLLLLLPSTRVYHGEDTRVTEDMDFFGEGGEKEDADARWGERGKGGSTSQ